MPIPTVAHVGLCGASFSTSSIMLELDISNGAIAVGTLVTVSTNAINPADNYGWTGIVTKYKNNAGTQYAIVQLTNTLAPVATPSPPPPPPPGGSLVAVGLGLNITIHIPSIAFAYTHTDPVDIYDIP